MKWQSRVIAYQRSTRGKSVADLLSAQLPVALVGRDGDGVGEVDAARVLARHRNAEKRLAVPFVKVFWKSRRLVAEHKRVARLEAAVVERLLAVSREEMEAPRLDGREIVLPCVVYHEVEMRPVVQPRPRDIAVVERESERPHEVERNAQPHAQPSDGARVVRNLRPHQDNREVSFHLPRLYQIAPPLRQIRRGGLTTKYTKCGGAGQSPEEVMCFFVWPLA